MSPDEDEPAQVAPRLVGIPAGDAADEARRKRSTWIRVGLVLAALGVGWVLASSGLTWSRETPNTIDTAQADELGWLIVDAVGLIEDQRVERGRLPTEAEIAPSLEEGITFIRRAEAYAVVAESGGQRLLYLSETPIADWIAEQGLSSGH